MRRYIFVLFFLAPLLLLGQANSEKQFTVTGKILDASSKDALEFATIVFRNTSTETIEYGGISNQHGNFSVKVSQGSYIVSVTFVSYKTKNINITSIDRNYDLGDIRMDIDTEFLDEIEIIGVKRALEIKPNKLVYNVGKDVSASGSMVGDVLNNIPSVSVDPDGNVSLMGQQNVAILIDNKVSFLTKASGLSAIPASSIERIEVIANPGAQYDSSAIGVINIVLKKGKDEGLNASITATSGYKNSHGGLVTFNHKSKKVNFYTNTSLFKRNPVSLTTFDNEYTISGSPTGYLLEDSKNDNDGNGLFSTIGLDYQIGDNAKIGGRFSYQKINNEVLSTTSSELFDNTKTSIASNERAFLSDFNDEVLEFQLDFEYQFDREGQQISSYLTLSRDAEDYFNNISNSDLNFTDEAYEENNVIKNKIFHVTYSHPISESSGFEMGYNGEFGDIPFRNSGNLGLLNVDYSKDVHAAFIDFEQQFDQFYMSMGMRAEFSDTSLLYKNTNSGFSKSSNEWFPSMYLEYSFTDRKILSMSYGRKISEPGYYQLNPTAQRISETSIFKGNETLEPVYVDMSNLHYVIYGNNFSFTSDLIYNVYHDYWQMITYNTGELIGNIPQMITTPVNLGKVDYYGLNLMAVNKVSKSISLTSNALLYYFDQTGNFETTNSSGQVIFRDYNHTSFNGTLSLMTQINIPKVFNFQTILKHELESEAAYSIRRAYTYLSMAISKDLFNNNATLALNANDLFNSYETERKRFDPNFNSNMLNKKEFSTILLSFTYRFNQSKAKREINFEKKVNDPILETKNE